MRDTLAAHRAALAAAKRRYAEELHEPLAGETGAANAAAARRQTSPRARSANNAGASAPRWRTRTCRQRRAASAEAASIVVERRRAIAVAMLHQTLKKTRRPGAHERQVGDGHMIHEQRRRGERAREASAAIRGRRAQAGIAGPKRTTRRSGGDDRRRVKLPQPCRSPDGDRRQAGQGRDERRHECQP